MKTIEEQLNEVTHPLIILACVNRVTGEPEMIEFHIKYDRGYLEDSHRLVAEHVALSQEQEDSSEVAFVDVDVDEDFSLDEHLEWLLEKVNMAVISSEWFYLDDTCHGMESVNDQGLCMVCGSENNL